MLPRRSFSFEALTCGTYWTAGFKRERNPSPKILKPYNLLFEHNKK